MMKKEKKNRQYSLRRVVSSWLKFSAVGNEPSPQAARSNKIVKGSPREGMYLVNSI